MYAGRVNLDVDLTGEYELRCTLERTDKIVTRSRLACSWLRGAIRDSIEAGGRVTVTLHWQALGPIERNYQVFVHLYDGELWAQHDGAPACAIWPTTRWEPGQIVADPHIVKLPAEMPDGPMPVLVGLYDLLTEDRLPVNGDPDGVLRLVEIDIVSG